MTQPDKLKNLLLDPVAWNRWRKQHPGKAPPDFSGLQAPAADLQGCDLHGVNLQGAYLRGACLRAANLRDVNLRGAYLAEADLSHCDLGGARLEEANLNGCKLSRSSLGGAHLRGADCGHADLSAADFTDADMLGTNMVGADLHQARFVRTKGLTSRQLAGGHGWQHAAFSEELLAGFGLTPRPAPPVPRKPDGEPPRRQRGSLTAIEEFRL